MNADKNKEEKPLISRQGAMNAKKNNNETADERR
jgi:hypothetical protein